MCLKPYCRKDGWLDETDRILFEKFGDDVFLCRTHFWRKRFDDLGIGRSSAPKRKKRRKRKRKRKEKQQRIIASRFCKICGGLHKARGYCVKHYRQLRTHEIAGGTEENFVPYELRPKPQPKPKPVKVKVVLKCKACGGKHHARGYCHWHYVRLLAHLNSGGAEETFSPESYKKPYRIPKGATCDNGCPRPIRCKGLCNSCYTAHCVRKRKERERVAAK